jgi:hypothetical protein
MLLFVTCMTLMFIKRALKYIGLLDFIRCRILGIDFNWDGFPDFVSRGNLDEPVWRIFQ